MFHMIVATDANRGIGKDRDMPWKLKNEMAYFKEITSKTESSKYKNAVIMGRTTWESIPSKFRPLANRINIVLTRQEDFQAEGATVFNIFEEALTFCANQKDIDQVFIMGGKQIYELGIKHPKCHKLYITEINQAFDCDTYFPQYKDSFKEIESSERMQEGSIDYAFKIYQRKT